MKGETAANENYQESLSYLFGLQRFGIKLGLTNISALLKHLGNPHAGLRAVHIAGSNGKGSTAAFLASVLHQAGYRVGLYTSPHLVDFGERIQINGVPISAEEVIQLTRQIREVAEKMKEDGELWPEAKRENLPRNFDPKESTITFFEFITAMAFLHFLEKEVEIAVLETGMGGRLDATNVINPVLSLITSISLEHQQYLGNTLLEIAGEKAGIIKARRPLLTSARQPEVLALLQRRCGELHSPFYAWQKDFGAKKLAPQLIDFQGRSHRWSELCLGLAGDHQMINASLALAGVEVLMESGFPIEETHLRRGLAGVKWSGRLELIGEHPRVLLDGAHNPEGTQVLRKALEEGFPRRRLILVLGIMGDKEIPRMMADLVPIADLLVLTRAQLDRAASLETLRAQASSFRKPTLETARVDEALARALTEAGDQDLILVAGSLYVVGEARAYLANHGLVSS